MMNRAKAEIERKVETPKPFDLPYRSTRAVFLINFEIFPVDRIVPKWDRGRGMCPDGATAPSFPWRTSSETIVSC